MSTPDRVPKTFDNLPEEVILNILRFVPSRALLSTVAFVSQKLGRIVDDYSLWNQVHFHLSDAPEFIAAVLARFANSVRSVTLWSGGVGASEKIRALIESKSSFEEIHVHLVKTRDYSRTSDLGLCSQLLSGCTRGLYLPRLDGPGHDPILEIPPSVHMSRNSQHLTSLDLSAFRGIDERIVTAIVASCPQLELLHLGEFRVYDTIPNVCVTIADGLPNLASVSFVGVIIPVSLVDWKNPPSHSLPSP
jgi:hypothetical protein